MNKENRILYISYDGLTEQLGQSQIVPYLTGLAKKYNNHRKFIILSFDKPEFMADEIKVSQLKAILDNHKIKWVTMEYHKKPQFLSTLYDVFCGIAVVLRLSRVYKIEAIHARSYVPALIALFFKKLFKTKFIFDMRGFWADERIEGGIWRKNLLYRLAKNFEKEFLLNSDIVVALTESAKNEIESFEYLKNKHPRILIIPTAVDLEKFIPSDPAAGISPAFKDALKGKFVFVYAGSLGTWYELDGLYDFFIKARHAFNNAHLLILTKQLELAKLKMRQKGLDSNQVTVLQADYESVPEYLNSAYAGLVFYKSGYSRKGCCPVKAGEYLSCGLPVVITKGIGDMDRIVKEEGVGVVVSELSDNGYSKAIDKIKDLLGDAPALKRRCRLAAERHFSLNLALERYQKVYEEILTGK